MTEYISGPDGEPIGPEVDELSEAERESLRACLNLLAANAEQVRHLAHRIKELGRSGADAIIVLIDVDDPTGHGMLLADRLMPGHDWQQYRDRGEVPVARGWVPKGAFPDILAGFGYGVAARTLAGTNDLQVIVLHAETVQVMEVQFP